MFCTTLPLAPFPLVADPLTPVPAAFVVAPVDPEVAWFDPVFVGAVDFVLVRPSDGVLILLVVMEALELTEELTLLTALLELKKNKAKN
jgi:hypothetical protein